MILQDSVSAALFNQIIGAVVAAAVGSGVTVIGFREKLVRLSDRVDVIARDHVNNMAGVSRDRAADAASVAKALVDIRRDFQSLCDGLSIRATDARTADRELFGRLFETIQRDFAQSERRQRYVMDVVTALAAKQGIHHRLTDLVLVPSNEDR